MARKKEFDRNEVLTKAMYTFLHYGYEGTSMQTLVSAMSINRGSLYDTFGDKRSLFLAAIAHYENIVVKQTIESLMTPDAGKQSIINLFRDLVVAMAKEEKCYGCLITNTAVELGPHDQETKDRINHNFDRIVQAFKHALNLAVAKGEVNSNCNIDAIAFYFTSSLQGLRVMGKVNRDLPTLNSIVDMIVATLD